MAESREIVSMEDKGPELVSFTNPELANFLGRNGQFKSSGMQVAGYNMNDGVRPYVQGLVRLIPVTSRDNLGRSFVEIPVEDLPDLIEQLQSFLPNPSSDTPDAPL